MSANEGPRPRVGLIAPKHSPGAMSKWMELLAARVEPYRRGEPYDAVWFLNVTREIEFIKRNTNAKVIVVAMEPKTLYPQNYDPALLQHADLYCGYRNFAGDSFRGSYRPFRFPAGGRRKVLDDIYLGNLAVRTRDFGILARHDPNIRLLIGNALRSENAVSAGPLFGRQVHSKREVQLDFRFEVTTENESNDFYCSEKIVQSLAAGCVPVYWGCRSVGDLIPRELFIDMRAWGDPPDLAGIQAIIAYCKEAGTYERFRSAIRSRAPQLLLETFTWEATVAPINAFLAANVSADQERRESLLWKLCWARNRLGRRA